MRQYYGLDVPLAPDDSADLARLSVLWTGLPRESRCSRRATPANEWSTTDYLLRDIEYWLHWIQWSKTKDAKHKRNEPEPIETPEELSEAQRKADRAMANKSLIARQLGYGDDIL